MKNLVLYPYDLHSESGKVISDAFNAKRVKPDGVYIPKNSDVILNWGMSETPVWANNLNGAKVLNHWDAIKVSSNKLKTFQKLKAAGVNIPMFSTSIDDARAWIQNGDFVVARKILTGSQGDGIVICKNMAELNATADVKMFVRYFKRKHEYRVFVTNGEIFDFSQKKKKEDFIGEHNTFVRNLKGGYVFCRDNVVLPEIVKQQSLAAAAALNLDITAIDIGWNESLNLAVTFEANCAFAFENGTKTFESVKKILNKYLGRDENVVVPPVQAILPPAHPVGHHANNPAALLDEIYSLAGISNLEFRSVGNKLRIYGRVAGIAAPVKIMEISDPNVTHWWQD